MFVHHSHCDWIPVFTGMTMGACGCREENVQAWGSVWGGKMVKSGQKNPSGELTGPIGEVFYWAALRSGYFYPYAVLIRRDGALWQVHRSKSNAARRLVPNQL